ncbi:MAG: PD-(D/E)XK nuclease family protein [Candidatus Thorarchaeota archaeon]
MVVHEYELNLSKTEYLYYLQCPRKFHIHRILNPLSDKMAFLNSKRTTSSYFLRNYDEKKIRGIIDHSFFETFHRRYYDKITDPEPPEEIASNQIKLLFWKYQQKKYLANPDYWIPYKTELRLMTEKQRGIIDSLELCSDGKGLRIIDYKSKPHKNDKLSLIFYANLFNAFRIENKEIDLLSFRIKEIGCYYYEISEEIIYNMKQIELIQFQDSLNKILLNISKEKFPSDSKCIRCKYFDICII